MQKIQRIFFYLHAIEDSRYIKKIKKKKNSELNLDKNCIKCCLGIEVSFEGFLNFLEKKKSSWIIPNVHWQFTDAQKELFGKFSLQHNKENKFKMSSKKLTNQKKKKLLNVINAFGFIRRPDHFLQRRQNNNVKVQPKKTLFFWHF